MHRAEVEVAAFAFPLGEKQAGVREKSRTPVPFEE
jgi:hypothetical protein